MRRIFRPSFGAALLVLVALPAWAQSAQEVIHDYTVEIRVLSDGDVRIRETIEYDFGTSRHHGIFRTIPSRYHRDSVYDRVYRIEDVSVTASGAPSNTEVSQEGSSTVIRIGDPDVEISGRHTYTIAYRVAGALNAFTDHDELYWNAIGDEWKVPIERAEVTVHAPTDIRRVTCFQGYTGSTEPCTAEQKGPTATLSAGRALQAYEGLSIVVAIPKGAVPEPRPILDERWSAERAFSLNAGTMTAAAVLLVVLGGGLFRMWSREGRDRRF